MRISRVTPPLLVPATTLALGLSLAACSVSVGGSESSGADSAGSGGATAEAATQGQDGSNDSAGSEGDAGSDTSDITDPGWLDALKDGVRTEVSGSYAVQGSGETLNLVGGLEGELSIQGSDVTVAAQDVGSLTVQGSDVTVYVRSVDTVTINGSDVTVYWLTGDPAVSDAGTDSTVTQLGQG